MKSSQIVNILCEGPYFQGKKQYAEPLDHTASDNSQL